jgi:hypothetical protein
MLLLSVAAASAVGGAPTDCCSDCGCGGGDGRVCEAAESCGPMAAEGEAM